MYEGIVSICLGMCGIFVLVEQMMIECDFNLLVYIELCLYISYVFIVKGVELVCVVKVQGFVVMVFVVVLNFLFIDEDLSQFDSYLKVLLLLCIEVDCQVLIVGFVDGMIDCIVLNYCFCELECKLLEFVYVDFGVVILFIVFVVVYMGSKEQFDEVMLIDKFIVGLC